MTRYIRNTAVLLELETVYGTDPVPTAGADALLVSNLSYPDFVAQNVDRDNIRPYFGNSENLVGTHYQKCGFDVEFAGSGAAGTAAAWGKALRACAFAEDVQAGYVAYTPLTDSQASCTIYWYDSGVFHKFTGSRGAVKLSMEIGGIPKFSFEFWGIYTALTAVAVPAVTLTAWQTPKVITDSNTGDVTFGAAYAAGALTGGTAYPSTGLTLDLGNKVDFTPLLGGESVDVNDRKATLKTKLDLTAAQEVTFMADVLANTLRAVSLLHGSGAGGIVFAHMPTVQFINPKKEELNGRRLIGYDGNLIPTTAGNDELVIVSK